MDYDDNDFRSQSFQITGEENTNFPLGLRSYSLPKFDLDDNLQVNLRFDSLVESEVLLGIQSREQNQWIEDFSGGSSGIEFNSSAAESCSISRRNNVWSEATSSESVEMLLKSVGQDEMIMGQTILEESDPCDGLGNLANQMELKSSQDGYDPSKIGDGVDVKLTLPIDKCQENLSDLCTDVADQLSMIEATPQIDDDGKSGTGSLVDLDPSSVSGQCSLAVTEGNLFIDGMCYNASKKEESMLDRSGGSDTMDFSNALVSNQLDSSHISVQTFATNAGELSNHVTLQVEGLQRDNTQDVGEPLARSKEAQIDEQICNNKAVETTDNNLLNSSGLALKVESMIPITEVSSDVVFPDSSINVNKWQGLVSCNDAEIVDQFVGTTQEVSLFMVGRDNNSGALSADLSSGGILSSPVQMMDPLPQIIQGKGNTKSSEKQGNLLEDDGPEYPFKQMAQGQSDIESTEKLRDMSEDDGRQLVGGISVSNTESLTVDDQLLVKGQVDTIKQVVSSSFVVDVCSSTNVSHVSQATEDTKDGDESDDVLGVPGVDLRSESHISSPMQICDKNLLGVESSNAHISPLDVSIVDKENATLHNDPGNEESEADGSLTVGKEVSSSSLGPSDTCAAVMVDQTPSDQSDQVLADESVSTVIEDVCILTFNSKCDDVHSLPSSSNVTVSEVIEYDLDAKSPLHGEDLVGLDKKEETVTELSAEPTSLIVKIKPQMKNDSVAVPEIEQGAVSVNAKEMLSETNDQSTTPSEAASATCRTEPHISIANNAGHECSKEESAGVHDSIMQENVGAEVVGVSSVEHQGDFLKTTGSLGETPLEPVPSPLHDSSCDDGLTNLDFKVGAGNSKPGESLLADKGDPVNGCKDSCTPAITLRHDSESHSLEAASSYLNSSEPTCGSPTVISCNELPQSEKENQVVAKGSLDKNVPVSNDIDLEGNNIKTTAHNLKESHASQEDRNFTFEVISVADLSQRRADNEWKPFSSMQPYQSPKIAQGSPPTTSSLCKSSHGSSVKSGGKQSPKTAKGNIGEKKTPISGKASRKTSNKGRPLKDGLSKSEKEHQEGGMGCLDKNTPVSDRLNQEDNTVISTSHDPKENNVTGGDINFTFEVSSLAHLSGKETGHGLKPFSLVQPYGFPQTLGASPSAPGLSQIDPKILQEITRGSPRSSGVKNVRRSSKGNAEDRTRPVSGKTVDRETSKEGKLLKETTPTKYPKERGSNSSSVTPSSIGVVSRGVERRLFGYIEGSGNKPSAVPAVQTSKLPDLNTSASSSALFHQPFSDFQQLQLRAQIFVYGSLIQGSAPEEACMVSAFGESDGGRSVWESVWRVAVERIQNQKSPLFNPETPLHLHSGARVPGQATKQIYQQSEMFSTPGRAGNKGGASSAIVNPMIPLSSPVWAFSTPRDGFHSSAMMRGPLMDSHQTLLPLHPYPSPHLRHFIGNATPWQPQVPSPATWVVTAPQTAALDSNVHHSVLPVSEAVHTTTVRESAVSHTAGMQPAPLSPVILNGGPISIPAGTSVSVDTIRTTVLPVKHVSSEGKPRKRKKSPASVELGEISSSAQPQADVEPVSCSLPLTASAAITTPASSMSKVTHGNFVLPTSPASSTHYQILGGQDADERVIWSEETCSNIEQAKQQAEDAAKLAASAVKHSENLWSQLAIQKNSGLGADVEAKLASSAVAIAAAAAVAKAAAAVAKVAFDAALQAKLMADEALVTIKSGNPTSEASLHDVRSLGNVTPASILKGKDRTNTSASILVAAKETAKKRVEAASAATKRAENLDAVLRAAEMAAEAVSQAGTIVAMGDPIPLTLNELVVAGAEGYWKVQNAASEQHVKSKATNMDQSDTDCVEQGLDISAKQYSERQSKETKQTRDQDNVLPPKETSRQSSENICLLNDNRWNSVTSSEKGVGEQNICQTSDIAKTIRVAPESQIGSANASPSAQEDDGERHQPIRTFGENSIEEGSTVEVLNYEGLRRVWFEAKVLSLKEGKAFVCYTELARDEGTGQQSKEWVPLEGEEGKAPRIRFPHPMSAIKYEGPGKRRRQARGDYTWSVGDRVDTWIHDGWWEAVITEKLQETEMFVQFSVEGDKSVVRSWNLRPCVIWKDGQWVEWCSLKENNRSYHEGDTPREKRPKLGGNGGEFDSTVEAIGKDSKPMHMVTDALGKPEASVPLALSAKEKIFTMGKSIREDNNSDIHRAKRTGLQKEGSRVIFGVPKPGKKRKFMEVSKHYVASRDAKASEGSDPIKFAKFLIPQESASSRGWKNPSKVLSKGKQVVAESKPKGLKMGKPQSLGRTTFEKDSSSSSVLSASKEGSLQDRVSNVQASVTRGGNISEKQKLVDPGSFHSTRKTAETQHLLSSSNAPYSKKKLSSNVAANLGNKGKVTASGEMLATIDENDAVHHDNPGKSLPGAIEPRRSNRRIQPTSRLLEGLQSSLTISKIPQVSHDRGTKTQPRSATTRGGNHG